MFISRLSTIRILQQACVSTELEVIRSARDFFRGESLEPVFSASQSPGFRAKFEALISRYRKKRMNHFLISAESDSPECLPRFQCENKRWDGTLC